MTKKVPAHIKWLKDSGTILTTKDAKEIPIWELDHTNNAVILSEWATHFRNHYCLDDDLAYMIEDTGKTAKEYFEEIKFPDQSDYPGPLTRSGDFAEILVADYVEYVLGYTVPRTRYINKVNRNLSTPGTDIIGYKIKSEGEFSEDDELLVFEAKASFTGKTFNERLQDAVNHSGKDLIRKAESLNAIKQRFVDLKQYKKAKNIGRFQNSEDNKFKEINGAAAVVSTKNCIHIEIEETDCSEHPNEENLILLVIHGKDLMTLAHAIYKRAADEA